MTDIAFSQIRPGQTVRVHYRYDDSDTKATVEGVVASMDPAGGLLRERRPYDVMLGPSAPRAIPRDARITRVELLAEPAPKWDVGQLAEIEYAIQGDGPICHTTAYWSGKGWDSIENGIGFLMPSEVIGEPRLVKAVPADARTVAQDAVVLPPYDGTGRPWNADALRERARRAEIAGQASAAANLRAIANAIEEAQR